MKDITPTPFGLLIAFFLPGLVALYGLTYWSGTVAGWMEKVQAAGTNFDLLSLVLLSALILGLELTVVRWLVFERLICRKYSMGDGDFESLSDEHTLVAFRAAAAVAPFRGGEAPRFPRIFSSGNLQRTGRCLDAERPDGAWIR